jgi:hypothetical protein
MFIYCVRRRLLSPPWDSTNNYTSIGIIEISCSLGRAIDHCELQRNVCQIDFVYQRLRPAHHVLAVVLGDGRLGECTRHDRCACHRVVAGARASAGYRSQLRIDPRSVERAGE